MAIDHFIWTNHAILRIRQRGLTRFEIEDAVKAGHRSRRINRGDVDWRVEGTLADGRRFVVIYDCPAEGNRRTARIVSAWLVRDGAIRARARWGGKLRR